MFFLGIIMDTQKIEIRVRLRVSVLFKVRITGRIRVAVLVL